MQKYQDFFERGHYFVNGVSVDAFADLGFRQNVEFNGMGGDLLPNVEKPVIIYSHDESTYNVNESEEHFWGDSGMTGRAKKSQGCGIMVSDFVCENGTGYLAFSDTQYESYKVEHLKRNSPELIGPKECLLPQSARVLFEYGKNRDGYWNNELFQPQLHLAIQIHNTLYPSYVAVFLLDCSSGHRKMANDALVASKMNKGPGGGQPVMRNGIGQMGALALCQHRNIWRPGMQLPEMISLIEKEEDFRNEKPIVQHLIESAGHEILWVPKYHCELNFIENVWAQSKKFTKEHCNYRLDGLRKTIPLGLACVSVLNCQMYARKSREYMKGYKEGANTANVHENLKTYKSHRRVFDRSIMAQFGSQ